MTYRFKCKAAADLIVTGPVGDQILRIIGKKPATTGILSVAAMPAALQALAQAIAQDSRHRLQIAPVDTASRTTFQDEDEEVHLRQRAWPFQEMMLRALDEDEPVVWSA